MELTSNKQQKDNSMPKKEKKNNQKPAYKLQYLTLWILREKK